MRTLTPAQTRSLPRPRGRRLPVFARRVAAGEGPRAYRDPDGSRPAAHVPTRQSPPAHADALDALARRGPQRHVHGGERVLVRRQRGGRTVSPVSMNAVVAKKQTHRRAAGGGEGGGGVVV